MPNPENIEPHKFQKGKSGNPKGRPKGVLNGSTRAKYWLDVSQKFKNPITGIEETLTQEDIAILGLLKKARSGDVRAFKELMDRAYGQAKAEVKIDYDYSELSDDELKQLIQSKLAELEDE